MILIAFPVLVFGASAALIWLLNRSQTHIGRSWLISLSAVLLVYVWIFFLTFIPDRTFSIGSLSENSVLNFPFIFAKDRISWPYMISFASMMLTIMLTAANKLTPSSAPVYWSRILLVGAIGITAISSAGIWSLIFCWMILDIFELALFARETELKKSAVNVFFSSGIRLTGTFLAAVAFAMSIPESRSESVLFVSAQSAPLLLIAAALRLGILPIQQGVQQIRQIELSSVLRITSILSILPILARIPLHTIPEKPAVILSLICGIAAFLGASGWVIAPNVEKGFSYFTLAVGSMAFACALRGQAEASILWGVSLAFTGIPLVLCEYRNKIINALLILTVIFFSGIPATPNSSGWSGLIADPMSSMDFIFILVMVLILFGSVMKIFASRQIENPSPEAWIKTIYPIAFSLSLVTHFLINPLGFGKIITFGIPPVSFLAFFLAIVTLLAQLQLRQTKNGQRIVDWVCTGAKIFWDVLQRFLNLNWLTLIGAKVIQIFASLIQFGSKIIERQGGILWEILAATAIFILIMRKN